MKLSFRNFSISKLIFIFSSCILIPSVSSSQFTFGGQFVQRAEYRHGYGKLIAEDSEPAAFVSHRLRLQGIYTWEKISLFASIQDIRTWGNTSQAKLTDNYLSLHEGWVLIPVGEYWSFQIGRQELNYDNVRFLGNLDWALQARAHDFARIRFEKNNLKLHAGGGWNQTNESLAGNTYSTADQYKTAQFLRLENKNGALEYSFLFWNNGRQYVQRDSLNQIIDKDTRFTQTLGISNLMYQLGNAQVSGFGYYQLGKDLLNRKVNAYDAGLQFSYKFKLNGGNTRTLKATIGYEVVSGTNQNNILQENNSFDPMYGTNHIHNGYMDYFYVGGRHVNSVGLRDGFARLTYQPRSQMFLNIGFHTFMADASILNENTEMNSSLGSEIDLTTGYTFNKALSIQAGYSQMFGTTSLEYLQGIQNPASTQNWIYMMLIFRPDSDKKYIGVML